MEKLINVQKAHKEMIEKLVRNYKKDGAARRTESYYPKKLAELQGLWDKFKANHSEILVLSYAEKGTSEIDYLKNDIFSEVEELFDTNYATMEERFIAEFKSPRQSEQHFTQTRVAPDQSYSSIKLPKIALEKFSGDYKKWPTFHDLFKSLVHENKSLCSVQKLQYLKLHLCGEAENLLRHIQVTENNYNSAWKLLTDRYENKRVLVNTHLKVLFSQNSLTAESSQGIKGLLDTTTESLQALENLAIDVSGWDPMIIFILVQKLPVETHELWEQEVSKGKHLPTWKELREFLEVRFRTLEAVSTKRNVKTRFQSNRPSTSTHLSQQAFHATSRSNCVICLGNHSIRQCPKFSAANAIQRFDIVKSKGLCLNCLGSGHILTNCPSQMSCSQCKKRHHTLLHRRFGESLARSANHERTEVNENITAAAATTLSASTPEFIPTSEHSTTALLANGTQQVLLATALVKILAPSGREQIVRALIDQGSQSSFITEAIVQQMRLKKEAIHAEIHGVGKGSMSCSNAQVHFHLKSLHGYSTIQVSGLVLRSITNVLPATPINTHTWDHIRGLELADPTFYKPGSIDLLLGADVYGEIIMNGILKGESGSPIAQETILGWVLTGRTGNHLKETVRINNFHTYTDLNDQLKQFWELEELPAAKVYTEEEEMCEKLFISTCKRLQDGRYEVELPFKRETETLYLGRSRNIAVNRFQQLENKFKRHPSLEEAYAQCINEYLELGHAIRVSTAEDQHARTSENLRAYQCSYLPHHGVIKESSSTTKLRVVFDASRITCSGISLNEMLMKGPVIQDELATLLLRWKLHKIVFTADIEKMYRQIKMRAHHAEYQRIVWRKSKELPIEDYKLLTVTFGTKSAPYLATRVLQQLAMDEKNRFPIAAGITLTDFYVDDLLSGTDDIESALEAQRQLVLLMEAGGFSLRKWTSNCEALLKAVPSTHRETNLSLGVQNNETVRTLGLQWTPSNDCFSYSVSLSKEPQTWTKRNILSEISKLFDPLGWISPVLIIAKMFMQKIWLSGLGWDDKLTSELEREWCKYRNSITAIENLQLPRWINYSKTNHSIEIHGFADASQEAYAAVIYICTIDKSGERIVSLLTSKTKVKPLKTVSLPRLELCAAALLAKLMRYVLQAMKFESVPMHAWTDSEIVIAWLKAHPSKWKTFIANRVSQIHELLGENVWSHVPTKENPADCASRGLYPTDLQHHQLWWNGPDWLRKPKTCWPSKVNISPTNLEIRKATAHHLHVEIDWDERYSSLDKLVRVTAYCIRFIRNARTIPENRSSGYLRSTELKESLTIWLRKVQVQHFSEELKCLQKKLPVMRKSRLLKLNPFLDLNDGLIRVGGRLKYADLPYAEKYPIILPDKCHLTNLMIDKTHKETLHGGLQLMMNTLGKYYWLLNARNTIRHYVHKCIVCYRHKASAQTQLMGNLPMARVRANRPFAHTGMDYCGPFELKTHKGRNPKKYKAYIAVFICMAVKAIHLELVTDLSADGFIAAFRRFCARRGKCIEVYCDCGTNFVGANKILQRLKHEMDQQLDKDIAQAVENEGVKFNFIPPGSPHFGGLWESGVRSTKHHLKRVLGSHTLTFEEFNTVLNQIEACLNSRPLCERSSDASDLNPLTPAHFLIGDTLITLPEPTLLDLHINRLDRWQLLQNLYQGFWKRWSSEYLSRLQQRPKWANKNENAKIGDLVLIKHDDLPPCRWALGRIVDTHPGSDGLVRVVTLKTKNSTIKRPIAKICILPIRVETCNVQNA